MVITDKIPPTMDKDRFDIQFREAIDTLVEEMAENSKVSLSNFYGMTCFMENLVFFSPVFHAMVEKKLTEPPIADQE